MSAASDFMEILPRLDAVWHEVALVGHGARFERTDGFGIYAVSMGAPPEARRVRCAYCGVAPLAQPADGKCACCGAPHGR